MALSTTASKVVLSGNGATTVFPYTFPIPDAASLQVTYTDTLGAQTALSPSLFSVTGLGTPTGGNVTYTPPAGPIAVGTKLTIARIVDYTQTTVFTNQGSYSPQVLEGRIDRVMMAVQQLADSIGRALVAPISDGIVGALPTTTQRANTFLGFDASGNPIATLLATTILSVSNFIQTNLLPAASAAAARTALGALATADVIPLLRSSLAGLTLSNDISLPNTTLDIAAGFCVDSTNAAGITLGAFTKKTGGAWAAGTGQNGMGNGLTIANSTWYHVFAILNAGAADVYFDTSVTAANKPAGTSVFRRIGSFKTNVSAQIVAFVQVGDRFYWVTQTRDLNGGSANANRIVNVPTGVQVIWDGSILFTTAGSGGATVDFATPGQASVNGSAVVGNAFSSDRDAAQVQVLTDTSAQISQQNSSGTYTVDIYTRGWIDRRGQDI